MKIDFGKIGSALAITSPMWIVALLAYMAHSDREGKVLVRENLYDSEKKIWVYPDEVEVVEVSQTLNIQVYKPKE